MENLEIYNKSREVPEKAKKEIVAGRLKGKTDINPMWRIKKLTEIFGPCGIGWKYEITRQWTEQGGNNEIAAFVNISLYIKHEDKWSDAIPGTGGSSFVANESKGPYVSDECFKMALTDAISVSCKALGFGADVYWDKDSTKYDKPQQPSQPTKQGSISEKQINRLLAIAKSKGYEVGEVKTACMKKFKIQNLEDLTKEQYDQVCSGYENAPKKGDAQ